MKRGDILELKITDFAFGGKGIAKIPTDEGDFIIFVENTFPGQTVKARIENKRKRHAECKLIELLERSELEVNLPFQEISGAPYIFVPIHLQEQYKKSTSLDLFKKIANIKDIEIKFDEFISSPLQFNYRNKMEYSFSSIEHDLKTGDDIDDAFALGFKRRGTWWKVENLENESGLFDSEFENKLSLIRNFLFQTNLKAWHPPKKIGFFRHLVVRKSFLNDELLINLVSSSEYIKSFDVLSFSNYLQKLLGERLAGFIHTINDNVADRSKIENGSSKLIFGKEKIIEKINDLLFEISMESFFQTNPQTAEKLYSKALDYVFEDNNVILEKSNKVVLDLFCGTGTIGQLLSKRAPNSKIIGVDIIEDAIKDAKKNAKLNNIDSIKFYASDVGKFLKEYPQYINQIDTIVLDPPRAGIAPKTLQKVIDLGANRIVYISCNPSTQARDAETLINAGYVFEKITLVDQFPHTSHIESIVKFVK
jgi:23S rRNA (uracil1939-C5)-methyltransferase